MKFKLATTLIITLAFFSTLAAQEKPTEWDLSTCINYAMENNIQIQKNKINIEQSDINLKQAKSQLLPGLSATVGQNFSNRPLANDGKVINTYSGNYGLNASMTLFNGGKLRNNIQQQKLQGEISQYTLLESEKNIQMSILQTYVQILYAQEAINVYEKMVETSQYQRDRGETMLQAGSISKVDLAKLEAQLSSDKYQLVTSQNTLRYAILQLKQLLELNLEDKISVTTPLLDETDVLVPLPSLSEVYRTALKVMPQVQSARLNIDASELETASAKAGYLPKISLSATLGTNHINHAGSFEDQLRNNFSDGIGLNISIPIFSNRENKSAVERAKLNQQTAQYDYITVEKNLLQEVELAYQDAVSAQSQFLSANENLKALQTSYELIEQQFNLGMKNTLDLLTERNNLMSAHQSTLQAKYTSIMNIQILNLYQNLPLKIN